MNGGPFSAVIAESQKVGCNVVAPETSRQNITMWSLLPRRNGPGQYVFVCLFLTHSGRLAPEL